jgi:predicted nucleic acid-binding protein
VRRVFVDTGGFFALLVAEDRNHAHARELFDHAARERWRLVTTNAVVTETYALRLARTREGRTKAVAFLDGLTGSAVRVERVRADDETLDEDAYAIEALLQLAVFAASAVVEALVHVEPVRFGLARDAPPDARQCLAPRFGNRLAAVLAGTEALSLREPAPRPFDSAVDRRVDLILHSAVLRPTDRHGQNIRHERTVSRRMGAAGCSPSVGAEQADGIA